MTGEEPGTPLPGVPHNLGVAGAAKSASGVTVPSVAPTAAPGAGGSEDAHAQSGEPYRAPHPGGVHSGQYGERVEGGADSATETPGSQVAAAPTTTTSAVEPTAQTAAPASAAPSAPTAPAASAIAAEPHSAESGSKSRPADRIVTLILLGAGALGALSMASSLYQLPGNLVMIASLLGATDVSVPETVKTISTIGALTILTLYALTLIFSLRRLSARKLTFWAPLTAGVLAIIISTIFTMSAMVITPEIMQLASDPGAIDKLMSELTQPSAN